MTTSMMASPIVHENWNKTKNLYNDIALLHIETSYVLTGYGFVFGKNINLTGQYGIGVTYDTTLNLVNVTVLDNCTDYGVSNDIIAG